MTKIIKIDCCEVCQHRRLKYNETAGAHIDSACWKVRKISDNNIIKDIHTIPVWCPLEEYDSSKM